MNGARLRFERKPSNRLVKPHVPRDTSPMVAEWPSKCPKYATMISAIGDCFWSCGQIQELLRRTGATQIGVIYYGKFGQISEFLSWQPWVREVIVREQRSRQELLDIASYPDNGAHDSEYVKYLCGDIPMDDIFFSHMRWVHGRLAAYPYRDAILPRRFWDSAYEKIKDMPSNTYLFHPWSFQSCKLCHHWQGWPLFAEHLLKNTDHHYLLTGQGYNGDVLCDFESERMVNLVDKIPHMAEFLAMACMTRGVITTPNSTALWSAIRRLNCFCIGNEAIKDENNGFYNFITSHAGTKYNWHTAPYDDIVGSFTDWIE